MQMSIVEVFICRRLHMNTSMIPACIWLICRLCTALHTKCCGAVMVIKSIVTQVVSDKVEILYCCVRNVWSASDGCAQRTLPGGVDPDTPLVG